MPTVHMVVLKLLHPYCWLRYHLIERHVRKCIVSFPKSGRTWVRTFLSGYVHKAFGTPHTLDFAFFRRVAPGFPRVVFKHGGHELAPDILPEYIEEFAGKDVLLLVRDPRDVVVSFYYETIKRDPRFMHKDTNALWSLSEFIRDERFGVEQIVRFMNLWYEKRTRFRSLTIVRYRDLRKEPHRYFRGILGFLGISIDEQAYQEAIDFSSFDNMRTLERQDFFADPRIRAADPNDPNSYKTRKGAVGGHKDAVSEEDRVFMNTVMKDLHPGFGYSTS